MGGWAQAYLHQIVSLHSGDPSTGENTAILVHANLETAKQHKQATSLPQDKSMLKVKEAEANGQRGTPVHSRHF